MRAIHRNVKFGDERLPERFWKRVIEVDSGCWLWVGPRCYGYGQYTHEGRTRRAHRVVFEVLIGPIIEETLDHLCRVKACVNPCHLEPCSVRDNVLRGTAPTARNAVKEACWRGHRLSGTNLYRHPNGSRGCRKCRVSANKRWKLRCKA